MRLTRRCAGAGINVAHISLLLFGRWECSAARAGRRSTVCTAGNEARAWAAVGAARSGAGGRAKTVHSAACGGVGPDGASSSAGGCAGRTVRRAVGGETAGATAVNALISLSESATMDA